MSRSKIKCLSTNQCSLCVCVCVCDFAVACAFHYENCGLLNRHSDVRIRRKTDNRIIAEMYCFFWREKKKTHHIIIRSDFLHKYVYYQVCFIGGALLFWWALAIHTTDKSTCLINFTFITSNKWSHLNRNRRDQCPSTFSARRWKCQKKGHRLLSVFFLLFFSSFNEFHASVRFVFFFNGTRIVSYMDTFYSVKRLQFIALFVGR